MEDAIEQGRPSVPTVVHWEQQMEMRAYYEDLAEDKTEIDLAPFMGLLPCDDLVELLDAVDDESDQCYSWTLEILDGLKFNEKTDAGPMGRMLRVWRQVAGYRPPFLDPACSDRLLTMATVQRELDPVQEQEDRPAAVERGIESLRRLVDGSIGNDDVYPEDLPALGPWASYIVWRLANGYADGVPTVASELTELRNDRLDAGKAIKLMLD